MKLVVFPQNTVVSTSKTIAKEDFKNIGIQYFYQNIFNDLGKRDNKNKLEIVIKWTMTLDINNCPFSDNQYRKYGTIDVDGIPVFYYIHFTVQEILDAIRHGS